MQPMSRFVMLMLICASSPIFADVLRVGDRSVEFDIAVDKADKPVRLAAFRGRWIVVTVGAKWCAPCKKELPIWDRLAGEVHGRFTFIAISVDDEVADGREFHSKLGLRNMQLGYMPSEKSAVVAQYGSETMPS